jgi:hypothetical protein
VGKEHPGAVGDKPVTVSRHQKHFARG